MPFALFGRDPRARRLRRGCGRGGGSNYVFRLIGTCVSGNGAVVAGATVYLHYWPSMIPVGLSTVTAAGGIQTTSDSSGNFLFNPPTNGTYKCTFHLAGAPNYFGITDVLVPS